MELQGWNENIAVNDQVQYRVFVSNFMCIHVVVQSSQTMPTLYPKLSHGCCFPHLLKLFFTDWPIFDTVCSELLTSFLNIYIYIQGVTGGTDQTSGECSLGQTIPI